MAKGAVEEGRVIPAVCLRYSTKPEKQDGAAACVAEDSRKRRHVACVTRHKNAAVTFANVPFPTDYGSLGRWCNLYAGSTLRHRLTMASARWC